MSEDADGTGGLPTHPIKLPDVTKASLREWVKTQGPDAFEAIISSIVEISAETHSGPLPSPQALRDYDDALPGLAERVVRLAERPQEALASEQQHRHVIEKEIVSRSVQYRDRGLWMGFAVAILAICAGFACAMFHEWAAATAFLCIPLAGVVSVLVSGKPWAATPAEPKDSGASEDDSISRSG